MIYPCYQNFYFHCAGELCIYSCCGKLALGFYSQWHRKIAWHNEEGLEFGSPLSFRLLVQPVARPLHLLVLPYHQVKEEGSSW